MQGNKYADSSGKPVLPVESSDYHALRLHHRHHPTHTYTPHFWAQVLRMRRLGPQFSQGPSSDRKLHTQHSITSHFCNFPSPWDIFSLFCTLNQVIPTYRGGICAISFIPPKELTFTISLNNNNIYRFDLSCCWHVKITVIIKVYKKDRYECNKAACFNNLLKPSPRVECECLIVYCLFVKIGQLDFFQL